MRGLTDDLHCSPTIEEMLGSQTQLPWMTGAEQLIPHARCAEHVACRPKSSGRRLRQGKPLPWSKRIEV